MSAQQFTFDDLKNILVNRIGIEANQVVNDPNIGFESLGLDSLAFVEIQLAVQQQYGFTISDEDAHHITTIGQAIEYTNRRLQEKVNTGSKKRTENSIVINAPMDLVWDVTNYVANWPALFTEYAAAEILDKNGNTVRFRLTMHPDKDGKIWSWVSERTTDPQARTVQAHRVETGPFDFMNIQWFFEPVGGGVKMRWVQEFHMKPTAPVNDDWMENNINTNTVKQMAIIKEKIEKRAAAGSK